MRILSFIAILLVAVTPAQAEWVKLDVAPQSGEAHFFDADTLQKQGAYRKIWVLSRYDEQQPGGHHATKILYQLNCAARRAQSVTILLYPDKLATKAVIGAHHDETRDWFAYSDQSVFAKIAQTACAD